MPSIVSLEYLNSQKNVANGIIGLDSNNKVPTSYISTLGMQNPYLGDYATVSALQTAYPTAFFGALAYITGIKQWYYWSYYQNPQQWVSEIITGTNYLALTDIQKAEIPYTIKQV